VSDPEAGIRRAAIEHALERLARAAPALSHRWVVLDRPDLVGPVAAAAGLDGTGRQVIAQFAPTADPPAGDGYSSQGASLLDHLLTEEGLVAVRPEPTPVLESEVRRAVGAPAEAPLVSVVLVGAPVVGTSASATAPASILAVNGWEGFGFTPEAAEVPTLPPMERFRTYGICGSCLKYGACRLGSVTRIDDDGVLRGSVTIPEEYAGSPGLAHGGFVATIFDDVLSRIGAHGVLAAMTGTYEVAFRGPVPTQSRLTIDATLDSVSGRKRLVSSRIRDHEDEVLAEASGTWIEVKTVPKTKLEA
jgi:acyl-coenzyme A thioesterase PaaI-like protein